MTAVGRTGEYLPTFKKFMYGILAIVLILSLMSIPLRASLIRDIWFSLSSLSEEPSANPWIYSIVAGIEVLHVCFLVFAFLAVLKGSPARSLITSAICIIVVLCLVISLAFVCCYGIIVASICVYAGLAALFAAFGQFVMYEEVPIEFVVRTRDGKTSPLFP